MKDKTSNKKVYLSEEIQEIMSSPPHSIIRLGNIFIFIFFLLFLLCLNFFNYPQKIECKVQIFSSSSISEVYNKLDGESINLTAKHESYVNKNQVLAEIKNEKVNNRIKDLHKFLNHLKKKTKNKKFDSTSYQNLESTFLNNSKIDTLHRELYDFFERLSYIKKSLYVKDTSEIYQYINELIFEIEDELLSLEQRKLIRAPDSGKLYHARLLRQNSFIKKNEILFYIEPENIKLTLFLLFKNKENTDNYLSLGENITFKLKDSVRINNQKINGEVIFISKIPKNSFIKVQVKLNSDSMVKISNDYLLQEVSNLDGELYIRNQSILKIIFDRISI